MDTTAIVVGAMAAMAVAIYTLVEVIKSRRHKNGHSSFNAEDRLALRSACEILKEIKAMDIKLVTMHENPGPTGFGTVGLSKLIERNTAAMDRVERASQELIHYFKWLAEKLSDEAPPPPMPKL